MLDIGSPVSDGTFFIMSDTILTILACIELLALIGCIVHAVAPEFKKRKMAKHNMTRQGVRNLDNIGPRKPKGKQLEEPPPEAFLTPGMGEGRDQDDMERYASDELYENRRESRRGHRS